MSPRYRIGLGTVGATALLSFVVCLVSVGRGGPPAVAARAAEDLGAAGWPLGEFQLVERSGRALSARDWADRVVIASFIFTRCPLSCPRISGIMKSVQGRLAGTTVQLASISVDPDHDTPEVLSAYAERFGADRDRWWFLTGQKSAIHELVQGRFKVSLVAAVPPEAMKAGAEEIVHSDRLALVDRGRVVGLYPSTDPRAVANLVSRARRLALPAWALKLPTVNASLNALSAVLLVAGWLLVLRHQQRTIAAPPSAGDPEGQPAASPAPSGSFLKAHIVCMTAAVVTSALFIASYLLYHSLAGSVPFPHHGAARVVYLAILLSHSVLAAACAPLVIVTVVCAARGNLLGHARLAPVVLPIWLYVSITGVVIYLMLYHWPVAAPMSV